MVGDDDRRKAVLGLWCLQGVGHAAIGEIASVYPDLSVLVGVVPREWLGSVRLTEPQAARLRALEVPLRDVANAALVRANQFGMHICHLGDPAYPRGLAEIERPPLVLFYWGRGDRPNAPRRLAMVGSRRYESNYTSSMRTLAEQLARHVIVVSGGAMGVDTLCHRAAMEVGGETWAFMGSGLDELDEVPRRLAVQIVEKRGTVFSSFPPGTRPCEANFPIRNTFIAGASDAVFVLRAGIPSGAKLTADDARAQGKVVYALPGQVDHESSRGINEMLRQKEAVLATSAQDVLSGMGVTTAVSPEPDPDALPVDLTALSPNAQAAYAALSRVAADFDTLLPLAAPLDSGQLASALVELELFGLLRQQPGRRFERA